MNTPAIYFSLAKAFDGAAGIPITLGILVALAALVWAYNIVTEAWWYQEPWMLRGLTATVVLASGLWTTLHFWV